jgi:hypothetical protein
MILPKKIYQPNIWIVSSFCAEVLILDQKNLKIEREIEGHDKEEKAISRSIASLSNKLLWLNLKLCEKKDYKGTLDKENLYMQNHYMNILKVCLLFIVIQNSVLASWSYGI